MKKLLILVFFISMFSNSQNLNLETTTIREGYFQSEPSILGNSLCKFKKNKSITILKVENEKWWFAKTKDCEGWVSSVAILLNEKLENALSQHLLHLEKLNKEKLADDIIQQKKRNEIQIASQKLAELNEKRIQDSINKISKEKDLKALIEKKRNDSIKKVLFRTVCHYTRNEIDKFDKVKIVETDYYPIQSDNESKYYFAMKLKKYAGRKYIYFSLDSDLGCVNPYTSDRSNAKILLENGNIITIYHSGDVNCSGDFTLLGALTQGNIINLLKSPIKSIRLEGTNYTRDLNDIEYKEFFIDKLNCIY